MGNTKKQILSKRKRKDFLKERVRLMAEANKKRAQRKLTEQGGGDTDHGEGSAQTSSEPRPGTSGEALESQPSNMEIESASLQEYTEPEVKIEPPDDAFTIVIQDPLTQTTLEGSYRELFAHGGTSGADPGGDPGADPGEEPSEDPDDNRLVIDEPPAKKPRQPPKPKPVLDINYYKAELARYKKEVLEQMTEIQQQHKQIKALDDEIFRLKRTTKTLRDQNTAVKKENSKLTQELRTAYADLEMASQKIIKMKRKEFAAKTARSLAGKVTKEDVTTEKQKELETQLAKLATQIEEQELATQIINSINDNLVELATQINKSEATEMTTSKMFANQLINSMNTQLAKLGTQIRKLEIELATQRIRQEDNMATQSILMEEVNKSEEASVTENRYVESEELVDTKD